MPNEKHNPQIPLAPEELDTADAALTGRRTLVEQFGLGKEDYAAIGAAIDEQPWKQPGIESDPVLLHINSRIDRHTTRGDGEPVGELVAPGKQNGQNDESEHDIFVPSADYRSIRFRGKHYGLTRNQAMIIKVLHEAHQRGTPTVGKEALLAAIEAETSRVRDSFRSSSLWGTLIIPNRHPRGTYRINLKSDK